MGPWFILIFTCRILFHISKYKVGRNDSGSTFAIISVLFYFLTLRKESMAYIISTKKRYFGHFWYRSNYTYILSYKRQWIYRNSWFRWVLKELEVYSEIWEYDNQMRFKNLIKEVWTSQSPGWLDQYVRT